MSRLDELRAKLAASEGRPGLAARVDAINAEIERLLHSGYTYRDAGTGQFVTAEYALANPETTYRVEAA